MKNYTAQWIENNSASCMRSGFTSKRKAIIWAQSALRYRLSNNGIGVWRIFLNAEKEAVAHGSLIKRNGGSIHYTTIK